MAFWSFRALRRDRLLTFIFSVSSMRARAGRTARKVREFAYVETGLEMGIAFPLLHPVWFNLLLLVLAWSIVGVAYQSNDDLVIASVLDGWGDPSYADAHVIFVNPLLTGLLLKVAPVLGGLSVWPVFLALATLSSGAAIFTMLTAHARKARRYDFNTLVLLLVWLLIMPGFYAALQFSHAAFLTGFTGVLVCLKYGSSWKGLCTGGFLCVLGSMIRLDAALVCDAFWGAILLAGSLDGFKPSRERCVPAAVSGWPWPAYWQSPSV